MHLDVLLRLLLGVLLGACLWAIGNRAHAEFPGAVKYKCARADGAYWSSNLYSTKEACEQYGVGWYPGSCAWTSGWANGYGSVYPTAEWRRYFSVNGASACSGSTYTIAKETGVANVTCPANSTKNDTTGMCSCNADYHEDGAGGCVSNSCPVNEHWNGTACECDSGLSRYQGVCTVSCPAAGTAGPKLAIDASASPGSTMCNGTCQYTFTEASNQYAVNGVQKWYGSTVSTGQFCTGSGEVAATNLATLPPSCPAGQVPGTINGTFACLPSSADSPAKTVSTSSTTSKDANGNTTGSSSTTTTTTDTGTGVNSSSTTVTRDGAGNVTGSDQKVQNVNASSDKNDVQKFCEQNPNASICKSSSWGGACGSFSCDGDAVQCAIAKEIYQRNCALFDTESALSTLGNQVTTGQDPQASQNPALDANRQSVSMSGAINQDTFLGQGGLADQQITVSPRLTVTLPWSQLNYYLSLMGSIVVAFALVAAARMVVGAG